MADVKHLRASCGCEYDLEKLAYDTTNCIVASVIVGHLGETMLHPKDAVALREHFRHNLAPHSQRIFDSWCRGGNVDVDVIVEAERRELRWVCAYAQKCLRDASKALMNVATHPTTTPTMRDDIEYIDRQVIDLEDALLDVLLKHSNLQPPRRTDV